MLVVVRCLEAWKHFLEGMTIKFEIWTDHKNLKYFMKVQKLNRRQARWALYLSRFNFMLKHIPGSKMGKVDNLSRRPDWEIEVERDNKDEMLVKREWLKVRKMKKIEVIMEGIDLLEKVRQSKVKDDEVVKAVDSVIYKEEKMYVPKDNKLRVEIIRLHYDTLVGEHGRQ